MKTLCIVPCGSRKIWDKYPNVGPINAENVYTGAFSKKCKEYAIRFFPSDWCILSAKYGLLLPYEIVPEPYNISFNDRKTNPITAKELFGQLKEKGLDKYERIVVLGGKKYTEIATAVFSPKEILSPLSECKGIGFMMGKLKNSIRRGVPL